MKRQQALVDDADAPEWRPSAGPRTLVRRAALMNRIRQFMAAHGVLEVDTPLIASAAPSERALDCLSVDGSGYLVPSPEHGLKRLLAADSGAIYQLGHVFRAGEVGRWHNPEFTMLEWYQPDAGLDDAIACTQALLTEVAGVSGVTVESYRDIFECHAGIDPVDADTDTLAACAERHDIAPDMPTADADRPFWLDLIMGMVVQPQLGFDVPVMVTGFPSDDAVLVATDTGDRRIAKRFECYWQGVELANGAEELVEPVIARKRMNREIDVRRARGLSTAPIDERLLAAMAHGLPPCVGVALGVDRLLALMLGCGRLSKVLPFDWLRR